MSHRFSIILLAAALLVNAQAAFAVTISAVTITNNSTPDETDTLSGGRLHEFRTASSIGGPVSGSGSLELTTQMQWYNGHLATGGVAQTHKRNVVYDLSFTVLDPTNSGYTLSIDTVMRGHSTAIWTGSSNTSSPSSAITATGTTLSGRFDSDLSDAIDELGSQVGDLTILGALGGTSANDVVTRGDSALNQSRSFAAGSLSGTRTFGLRFTTATSSSTNVLAQNGEQGQGSVRYGLNNLLTGLDLSGQPQAGDLSNDQLGHFVTIRLTDLVTDPGTLPSPGSLWLLLGGALLGWRLRSR